MRNRIGMAAAAAWIVVALAAGDAAGQMAGSKRVSFELRSASVVPTFDIADAANTGFGGGFGVGVRAGERFRLMADFDFGLHGTDIADQDIHTYHFMGKLGYDVFRTDRIVLAVNLGAGAVAFGGDLPETKTYPAINAGAKLGIRVSPTLELLISPQGDIAFTDEAELGTSNAWVWPLGVGFRLGF